MLLIKVIVQPSSRDGLGVFAAEKIPKGTMIWQYDPRFDISYTQAEVDDLPEVQREFIDHYAYLSKKLGKYVLPVDDTRFTNHSAEPNIDILYTPGDAEVHSVANRDIRAGEELCTDYRTFDSYESESKEEFLTKK